MTGLVAGMGVLIGSFALVPTRPTLRYGSLRGAMPPLLRAIVPGHEPSRVRGLSRGDPAADADGHDIMFVLLRVEEREFPDRTEGPGRTEGIVLQALSTDDGWRAWSTTVVSVPRGGAQDAAILGLQGRTLWVWADGLHALDATQGKSLADPARLAALNPGLPLEGPELRRRFGFAEALTLDGLAPGQGWAFDPASLRAFRRAARPPAPLPPTIPAGGDAQPLVPELRVGNAWFGVVPEDVELPEAIAAQDASGHFLPPVPLGASGPWRLWRGRVRPGGDVLEAVAPPRLLAGEGPAGLLGTGSGGAVTVAGPDSVFVLHDGGLGGTRLVRLGLDGQSLWDAPIGAPVLVAVANGARRLVLLGGEGPGGQQGQALFSVTLADGAVRRIGLSA